MDLTVEAEVVCSDLLTLTRYEYFVHAVLETEKGFWQTVQEHLRPDDRDSLSPEIVTTLYVVWLDYPVPESDLVLLLFCLDGHLWVDTAIYNAGRLERRDDSQSVDTSGCRVDLSGKQL